MNFNFGEVLSRAWQIIWKHKVLWIFGILAGCSSSRFSPGNSGSGTRYTTGPGQVPPQVERLFLYISQHAAAILAITLTVICIIWIVLIFLGTIGKIGLIRGTWQADGGADKLIFGQLFSESMPYFWRIFGLSLILAIPVLFFVIVFTVGIVILAASASQIGRSAVFGFLGAIPLLFCCICLLIPVMWVLGLIFKQAERSVVLEDSPLLPSISRGWDVFRTNLGSVIVMAVILAVITLVVGFIIAIPILVVVIPTVFAFAASNGRNWAPLAFMGVCLLLYLPITLVINGIMTAYIESAWTLTYMRLTGRPGATDIVLPESGTPPSLDNGDKTIVSATNA